MDINPSGLSSLRAISVPLTRKDNSRQPPTIPPKNTDKPNAELVISRQGSEPVFKQADAFRQTSGFQHATGQKERVAIEAYESISKEQQRQDIQLMLGVDTFV